MIAGDAFDNSEWGRVQPRPIVINQLLFKADCKDSILTVPKGVKRFRSCLFANNNVPSKIVCDFVPLQKDVESLLRQSGACRSLEIISENAEINLNLLKKFTTLGELILLENHTRYKTRDGVLYSHDGKSLLFIQEENEINSLLFQMV